MAGKTEVAQAKNTAVAEGAFDYGEHSHAGFEGTTIADLSIPFIKIMQSNSPEVEDELIPGVKSGDLVNSVSKEILKQPLIVQPVFKEAAVVEWVPRNKGGGLAGRHELDSEVFLGAIKKNGGSRIPPKDADGKRIPFKSPDGNDLVETYYIYCLVMDETGEEVEGFCVLSFASTNIKVYKDWLTSMYSLKGAPPMYANRCKVSTAKQKNESGTFYTFSIGPLNETYRTSLINPGTPEGQALLTEGRDFAKMIDNGLARADFDSISGDGADADAPAPNKGGSGDDDEMPF